jgi:Family of unknown function (DUF6308)
MDLGSTMGGVNGDALDFTSGFPGDVLGLIPVDDAVKRVVAFCCWPRSGFVGYDLAGHKARTEGRLADVGPWTILLADAPAGRVAVRDVHSFAGHVHQFAELIDAVHDKDLARPDGHGLDGNELAAVVKFCQFGFPGAWAPKITKTGALFRPRAIPILDGWVARAFGYKSDAFSAGRARKEVIERVVKALTARIEIQAATLSEVRRQAKEYVPVVTHLSNLRLADIIIWTSQDDRMERRGKRRDFWLRLPPGEPPTLADVIWVPLATS